MKSIKKTVFILLIFLLILLSGYLRDFIFKKINALLQAWDYDFDYQLPAGLQFLNNYEYDTVVNVKWLLTFLFWGLYLFISIITIRLLFRNRQLFLKITVGIYSVILLISGIFMSVGFVFSPLAENMYEFSRYLMGMAQSPLILMILIPVFSLYEKGQKNKKE